MRKLYEINADIENLIANSIDEETGEVVIDNEALEALEIERSAKIESVMLYVKDLNAEVKALSEEMVNLSERKKRDEKQIDGLMFWLSNVLNGEKFSTPKVEGVFRKSVSVEADEDFCQWAYETGQYDFINHKETVSPDKRKIMNFLKSGGELEHVALVEKNNLTIK